MPDGISFGALRRGQHARRPRGGIPAVGAGDLLAVETRRRSGSVAGGGGRGRADSQGGLLRQGAEAVRDPGTGGLAVRRVPDAEARADPTVPRRP